jgi:hypothetical protein
MDQNKRSVRNRLLAEVVEKLRKYLCLDCSRFRVDKYLIDLVRSNLESHRSNILLDTVLVLLDR